MSAKNCQYIKTCKVYQGDEAVNGTPIAIYKNVFCQRGIKGWNNCAQFLEFEKASIAPEK